MASNSESGGTNFTKEIGLMMYAFGDNAAPDPATIKLIESIIAQKMKLLLQEAAQVADERGQKNKITNYEIIFLMRNNILKLKKLHDFQLSLDRVEDTEFRLALWNFENPAKSTSKRTHISIIQSLDSFNQMKLITFDPMDHLRKVRASKFTETMPGDQYINFHEAKCTSFRNKKGYSKLEKWVNPDKELHITVQALEVLGFLAHDTVAEIIDAVFLIRQDSKKQPADPFSKYQEGVCTNPGSLNNMVYTTTGFDGPPITVTEVEQAVKLYMTPKYVTLNSNYYNKMGFELPVPIVDI